MLLKDKTICEARDAVFFEHIFPMKKSLSSNVDVHDSTNESSVNMSIVNVMPSSSLPSSSTSIEMLYLGEVKDLE